MKKNLRVFIVFGLLITILTSSIIYLTMPVRAEVLNVDIPNKNMEAFKPLVMGDFEFHLTNFSISGFFKDYDNNVITYHFEIGKADVLYTLEMTEDLNISVKYSLNYQDLNFTVSSESFSIVVDYVQISSDGELVITIQEDDTVNLIIYEMVPRYTVPVSRWALLETILEREVGSS